ncbi:MAG: HEPN domain-containing protein [Planctomycetes bacterium]|nr:HEPN domain-containing protein [Planctomycetota bacterium]
MTPQEATAKIVRYWMEQADEAIASARREQRAGALHFAHNRAYYACFYAASAVLLNEGQTFKRHTGVREGVHQYLVKPGRLDKRWGRVYSELFQLRGEADYVPLVAIDPSDAAASVDQAEAFVQQMRGLLSKQID